MVPSLFGATVPVVFLVAPVLQPFGCVLLAPSGALSLGRGKRGQSVLEGRRVRGVARLGAWDAGTLRSTIRRVFESDCVTALAGTYWTYCRTISVPSTLLLGFLLSLVTACRTQCPSTTVTLSASSHSSFDLPFH